MHESELLLVLSLTAGGLALYLAAFVRAGFIIWKHITRRKDVT